MELGAWDRLFPGNVGAEVGGVRAPSAGGGGGEEGSAADFAGGKVSVRTGACPVSVSEEEGVAVGEVGRGGAVVLVDFDVGDLSFSEVVWGGWRVPTCRRGRV